jgi:hypothetical protein
MKLIYTLRFVLFLLGVSITGNCALGPVNGLIVTNNDFAGEFNPANDVNLTKSAESCQHTVLWLYAYGTASAGKIALDNGIQRIGIIDHSTVNVFQGLYSSYCTTVVGE